MTLNEQIKFIQNLDNSGPKFAVLETLKLWKKHFPEIHNNSVLVGMSHKDYKIYLEFREFLIFKNQKS